MQEPQQHGLTPQEWAESLSGPPTLSSEDAGWPDLLVRRFVGVRPAMSTPGLRDHVVVIHLGGGKEVTRRLDGHERRKRVRDGDVTFIPAFQVAEWNTKGPVDFLHLYVRPDALARVAEEELEADPARLELVDRFGASAPLIEQLGLALQDQAQSAQGRAYADCLARLLLLHMVCEHASARLSAPAASMRLAPCSFRRATEFIEEHLSDDIGLADMARAAGLSQFHFSRAFRRMTGLPPYRWLTERRVERGKALLEDTQLAIVEIAFRCGFQSQSQFTAMFRQVTGTTPRAYRLRR